MATEATYKTRDTELDIDQLVLGKDGGLPNFRERTGLEASSIKELAESIAERGVMDRLKVWINPDEEYVVFDGERRARAIKLLKDAKRWNGNKVPVTLYECEQSEAMALAMEAYLQREGVSGYELAMGIERMQAALGDKPMSYDEISARVHKSKPWISRTYGAYRRASEALRKAWAGNKVPTESVIAIAELPQEKQEEALQQQLAIRSEGGKKAAGKARSKAKKEKKTYDTGNRPSIADIRTELSSIMVAFECDDPEKFPSKKIEDAYSRGVVDTLRYVNGSLDYTDLEKSYDRFHTKCLATVEERSEEPEDDEPEETPVKKTTKKAAK